MIKISAMFSLKIHVILEAHINRLVSQTTREVLHVYNLNYFRSVCLFCSTRKHAFSCDKMAKRQSYYLAKKKTTQEFFSAFRKRIFTTAEAKHSPLVFTHLFVSNRYCIDCGLTELSITSRTLKERENFSLE